MKIKDLYVYKYIYLQLEIHDGGRVREESVDPDFVRCSQPPVRPGCAAVTVCLLCSKVHAVCC